jgi:DNA-binding protein Fis
METDQDMDADRSQEARPDQHEGVGESAGASADASAAEGKRQRLFGPHADEPGYVRPPVFGRRVRMASHAAMHRGWLRDLYNELRVVFSDPVSPQEGPPLAFLDADKPVIQLGDDVTIGVDDAKGTFVFQRTQDMRLVDTITTSDGDRVTDFVVAYLARIEDASLGGLAHVEKSVGRTIEDVERALILATLRHCGGNRTLAAGMLGISRRMLRAKLQSYWASLLTETRPQ